MEKNFKKTNNFPGLSMLPSEQDSEDLSAMTLV